VLAAIFVFPLTACAQENVVQQESAVQGNPSESPHSVSEDIPFEESWLFDYYKTFEDRYLKVKVGEGYFNHNYDLEPVDERIHYDEYNRYVLRRASVAELPNRLECQGIAMQGGLAICKLK